MNCKRASATMAMVAGGAIAMAVRNGVRAHHWNFGDMPPVRGLTEADVKAVTAYVRAVQRASGIE